MKLQLAGPLTRLGGLIALAVFVLDQATKIGVMRGVDFGESGIVPVAPFLDLVVVWNTGISYGLVPLGTEGWWVLALVQLAASAAFVFWLARVDRRLEAVALGLLIGGALGNTVDRAAYGAVFDFLSLHAFGWRWYVFNIADAAIVAGIILLIYDSFFGHAVKSPPSNES
ncbi:signal peptidase II [Bosea sp. 117]|uniref:signal peptidase II n=1 Tax=Bosea sp. 117 TaxID=1125973 RepID=UPI0004942591|nr:signal peptidase II [Bosea sp. 117]